MTQDWLTVDLHLTDASALDEEGLFDQRTLQKSFAEVQQHGYVVEIQGKLSLSKKLVEYRFSDSFIDAIRALSEWLIDQTIGRRQSISTRQFAHDFFVIARENNMLIDCVHQHKDELAQFISDEDIHLSTLGLIICLLVLQTGLEICALERPDNDPKYLHPVRFLMSTSTTSPDLE